MVYNKLIEIDTDVGIEDLGFGNIKTGKQFLKDIITYQVGYEKIYGVKSLHLIYPVVVGYIKEDDFVFIEDSFDKCIEDGYKFLSQRPINKKNKDKIRKQREACNKTHYLIKQKK